MTQIAVGQDLITLINVFTVDPSNQQRLVNDSGEQAPFTAAGTAIPNDIIATGGGHNIFADVRNSWTEVGWEQVVARRPELIIIVDYGEATAAQKKQFLQSNPVTQTLPAVQYNQFLVLPYLDMTPGPGNVDAVERLNEALAAMRATELR